MRNSKTINPQRLAELRERLGLSQKALAAKLRVDVGTVSRWEQGKIRRVRRDVFGKLCATLNTDRDELCGDGPLPTTSVTERAAEKGKLPVAISTFARNALTLVADRYGLEQDQIIELAPLLFFMAAERSLKDRRDFVREQREAINTVSNLRTHLPFAIRDIEPALAIEETSIQKRDLFGDLIVEEVTNAELESEADWEAGDYSGALQKNPFDLDFWESDSKDPNPFRSFLTKELAKTQGTIPMHCREDFWPRQDITYAICKEEALALVGGDTEAAAAILNGSVVLDDMLKSINQPDPTKRAEWVRTELEKMRGDTSRGNDEKAIGQRPTAETQPLPQMLLNKNVKGDQK